MASIITADISIQYVEGKERASQKKNLAIAHWSQKWDANGQDVLSKYYALADESIVLEGIRLKILKDYDILYAKINLNVKLYTLKSLKNTDQKMQYFNASLK